MVEILSSDRSHDLVRKRQIYAEAGVREYWILDPRHDTVTLLELRGGVYAARAALAGRGHADYAAAARLGRAFGRHLSAPAPAGPRRVAAGLVAAALQAVALPLPPVEPHLPNAGDASDDYCRQTKAATARRRPDVAG